MASLYPRGNIIWIKYRDVDGKPKRKSLNLREDVAMEKSRARRLCSEYTQREQDQKDNPSDPRWSRWVPGFLATRYHNNLRQHYYVDLVWNKLSEFLTLTKIDYPAQLRYVHVVNLRERFTTGRAPAKKPLSPSSIYTYLNIFSIIMAEAVRREYATQNPLKELEFGRSKIKVKPEITDAHMATITKAIKTKPAWMQAQFQIALYTGCRLHETYLPIDCINLTTNELHFPKTKTDKPFSVPIHRGLRPFLEQLIQSGATHSYPDPKLRSQSMSSRWSRFFQSLGMPYTFHCFRVTFINRGRRAGIDRYTMMKLVGHNSSTVHEIYSRWDVARDLTPAVERIHFP
jgi:hypothetical protein